MMLKRLLALVALLIVVISSLAFATPAMAQSEAAEACRAADEEGILDGLGVTRGECVNSVNGPSSENANNFLAAFCGEDFVQALFGTTNKGQCIELLWVKFGP